MGCTGHEVVRTVAKNRLPLVPGMNSEPFLLNLPKTLKQIVLRIGGFGGVTSIPSQCSFAGQPPVIQCRAPVLETAAVPMGNSGELQSPQQPVYIMPAECLTRTPIALLWGYNRPRSCPTSSPACERIAMARRFSRMLCSHRACLRSPGMVQVVVSRLPPQDRLTPVSLRLRWAATARTCCREGPAQRHWR